MKSPRHNTRLARASHGQMGGASTLRPGQGLTSAGNEQPPTRPKRLYRRVLFALAEMRHGHEARGWGLWWRFDHLSFYVLDRKP